MLRRLDFIEVPPRQPQMSFCNAVAEGLAQPQKTLPCRFFYDSAGSHLFEQICGLPEYYLTRTEQRLLQRWAPEMVAAAGSDLALVEFGSGSSCKTRILMDAIFDRQEHLPYVPIDISSDFLRASTVALLGEYPRLSVTAVAAEYNEAIEVLPTHDGPRLILFLGSNIGNFEAHDAIAFLSRIRQAMQPQDRLLIGVDLVKDRKIIERAYNDAAGVTAAFNKNLLERINRELGGNFALDEWTHQAPFVCEKSRIEMRLVSRSAQTVRIRAADRAFRFAAGEYIHTECSHKYTLPVLAGLCGAADLTIQQRWQDDRGWFTVLLLRPEATP